MRHQEELEIHCPYCGESIWILVDGSVEFQQYVEDCQVCCQAIDLAVRCEPGMAPGVTARRQDDV